VDSIDETNIGLKSFVETHSKDLNSLHSFVTGNVSVGLDKLHDHSSQLTQFMKYQKEVEQRQQKEIQELFQLQNKQMEELLKQQNTLREEQSSRTISEMREQLMSGITGFFQINQTLKDSNTALHHRVSNFGEGVVNRNNSLKTKINTSDESLTQFSSSVSNTINSSSSTLQNDLKNICQTAFTDLKHCDALVDDCQNNLKKRKKKNILMWYLVLDIDVKKAQTL